MLRLTATDLAAERGGREVFSRLSLAVGGGLLAVTGPNGPGKSTLLRLSPVFCAKAREIRLEPEADTPARSG
jgi:ABC-type transport system involved in cytochrome c biogenesis ATPase subunit